VVYSKAKLKSDGDKASPCFRPFCIGNVERQYNKSKLKYIHEDIEFERFSLSSESFISSSAFSILKIKMCKVVILHVALYEFKILSLLLRKVLKVFYDWLLSEGDT
jgi:hypothetical protein